uniref:NADH-ubiquinone oxidoreductase chain 6 n=1 Tax=Ministeria vibrans TaxID=134558 RepID=M1JF66_MINVI|nr:NADH dehydrogenase subunit 6 [Ministeria vibrans]AGE93708.1 NADH dehydrogenase subunit 6 [Ministeria vibrans]
MLELWAWIWINLLLGSIICINVRNAVHSLLSLIYVFLNGVILIIAMGTDFIGLIFLIVYIGAIAILFLFVVMMLNIKNSELTTQILPIYGSSIIVLYILNKEWLKYLESFIPVWGSKLNTVIKVENLIEINWINQVEVIDGIKNIGDLLYKKGDSLLILSSTLLLLGMVGAIILSLEHNKKVKRQDLYLQLETFNYLK